MPLIFKGYTQQACPDCLARVAMSDDCNCQGRGTEYVEGDVLFDAEALVRMLDKLAVDIHSDNRQAGWWTDLATGADLIETRNRGEMLMLCVTELSEGEEADDYGTADDKLPQYLGLHVEIADCAIRLLDLIGAEQRRCGEQPLVTFHLEHGATSPADCYPEFLSNLDGHAAGDLMRIVRDISKALDEGYRKDKIKLARYWLTTALFRIIAYCALSHIDLFNIIEAKRSFNRNRADHKVENRRADGGKKC